MSVTREIVDDFGKPLDKMADTCDIVYKVNGKVKRIEHIVNGCDIQQYTYYLSDGENVSGVLYEYMDKYLIVISITNWGSYKIEETQTFDKAKLFDIYKTLYDQYDNDICWQDFDFITKQPIIGQGSKHFFEDNDENKVTIFNYDKQGFIASIKGQILSNENISKPWIAIDHHNMPSYLSVFLDAHPYYKGVDFLPDPGIGNHL